MSVAVASGIRIRKNAASLSSGEKEAFITAVKKLKASKAYDKFIQLHALALYQEATVNGMSMNVAHRGPGFLPWHREFLQQFENALQSIDPSVTIPYWDWAYDPNGDKIFTDDFMGGDGDPDENYAVTTGPFQAGEWQCVEWNGSHMQPMPSPDLERAFGVQSPMPTFAQCVSVMQAASVYDTSPWNDRPRATFRLLLETVLHNRVHMYVGGHMGDTLISPNDPVFWLHHANVDRLWARWQEVCPSAEYEPLNVPNLPPGVDGDEPLWGFNGPTARNVWDLSKMNVKYQRPADGYRLDFRRYLTPNQKFEKTPSTITENVGAAPSDAEIMVAMLSGFSFWREPSQDHHLRELDAGVLPDGKVSDSLRFLFGFTDNSNRAYTAEISSPLLYLV